MYSFQCTHVLKASALMRAYGGGVLALDIGVEGGRCRIELACCTADEIRTDLRG